MKTIESDTTLQNSDGVRPLDTTPIGTFGRPDVGSKMAVIHDAAEKAFEAESARAEFLIDKIEKYFVAITALAIFQVVADAGAASSPFLVQATYWISFLLLGAAFVLIVLAAQVSNYVGYPEGAALYFTLKPATLDEANVHDELAKVLLEARDQNAAINQRKANLIKWSEYLLLAGVVATIATRLIARLQ